MEGKRRITIVISILLAITVVAYGFSWQGNDNCLGCLSGTENISLATTYASDGSLTYIIMGEPSNGVVSLTGPTVIYTPNPGFVGVDSFTFKANDGQVDSNIATVTITVFSLADVNADTSVNVLDLVLVGQHWGETGAPGWIRADVNKDSSINVLDMVIIGQRWSE